MESIGLIGIGNIGSHFARRLREAGYPLTVFDIDAKKMDFAVGLGARPAATPGEVAENSDIVLLCLPGSPAVEEVMEKLKGIISHLRRGHLIIDTGTTRPDTDIRYAKECEKRGAGFIDAPITWRSKGLIIMVGGSPENFERGKEVLSCLSYKLKHIGPIGHGQMLKLMNQMVLAGQLAVWAEVIEWGKKGGIDPRLLRDYLEFPIEEALYGDDFHGSGTLALHYKDLQYALQIAHDNGANAPVTSIVHEAFKAAKVLGEQDWSQPGIATYWRRLNRSE